MSLIGEAFVRVRAIADTVSFEREASRALRSNRAVRSELRQTEREFGRFTRGALVGSGALRGLGRSAAFASATFVGGAGLVYALRSTLKAATDTETTAALLKETLDKLGISFAENQHRIDRAVLSLSELAGLDTADLNKSFTVFIRSTRDVNKALILNALAADISRARHIELASAVNLVVRASQGNAGALRRVGIAAKSTATTYELIALLQRKYAGSAEAYGKTSAGAQDRFRIAVAATQSAIGTELLPTLTRYLDKGTEWLNQEDNQVRIQREVNRAVRDGEEVIRGLSEILQTTRGVLRGTVGQVLDLKEAVQLLIALMAVAKVRSFAKALGLIGPAAVAAGAGVATAKKEIVAGGAAAEVATARIGGLRAAFLGLGRLGPIALAVVADITTNYLPQGKGSNPLGGVPILGNLTGFGEFLGEKLTGNTGPKDNTYANASAAERAAFDSLGQGLDPATGRPLNPNLVSSPDRSDSQGVSAALVAAAKAKANRDTATATALAKAQAEGSKAQIVAASNARLGYIRETIAFAKRLEGKRGPTKELEATLQKFYADEASTQGIIDQINEEAASAAEQASNEAEAAARKAAEEAKRQAAARQRAYEALVRTRLVNLRAEVAATKNGTDAHRAAEADLRDALRDEIRDAKLSAEKRAGYHAALVNETNREAAERQALLDALRRRNEKEAAARKKEAEARKKQAQEERDRIKRLEEAGMQNLQNAVARAQLIQDPDRELRAEKKADQAIIDAIKKRIREKRLTGLALANATGELIAAERNLQDLTKRKDGGFSLQDLFKEAGSEFATYGSNIGPRGAPLSPQDSRASLAQTVSTKNIVVIQNFGADRESAPALVNAFQVARNMK